MVELLHMVVCAICRRDVARIDCNKRLVHEHGATRVRLVCSGCDS